jgi:hypothetical protein
MSEHNRYPSISRQTSQFGLPILKELQEEDSLVNSTTVYEIVQHIFLQILIDWGDSKFDRFTIKDPWRHMVITKVARYLKQNQLIYPSKNQPYHFYVMSWLIQNDCYKSKPFIDLVQSIEMYLQ